MTDVTTAWFYTGLLTGAYGCAALYVLLFEVPEWIRRRRKANPAAKGANGLE